jgi:uncharacterized Zn finger protein (UPF0148 family)
MSDDPHSGWYCDNCGRAVDDSALFCPQCGDRFEGETAGEPEGLRQSLADFDKLRLELANVTNDWTIPVVVRSYDPGDDGHEDYEDEAMLFEEHGYHRSVVQDEAVLTATYRKTARGAGSPAIIEAAFCPKCGTARPNGAAFCPKCGAQFEDADREAVPRPAEPPVTAEAMNTGSLLTIVGGGLAIIGAILPWASVLSMSLNGLSRDGMFSAAGGAVALLVGILCLRKRMSEVMSTLAGLGGLVALGIAVTDGPNLAKAVGESGLATMGPGIYVTGLGGIFAIIGAVLGRRG